MHRRRRSDRRFVVVVSRLDVSLTTMHVSDSTLLSLGLSLLDLLFTDDDEGEPSRARNLASDHSERTWFVQGLRSPPHASSSSHARSEFFSSISLCA